MSTERLDKIISTQLNISRRDAKEGIRRGLASINGEIIRTSDFKADVDKDKLIFNGQTVVYKSHIYILMNKPKGILSASDDKKRQTVVDIVPDNLRRPGLFPVGRLDRDTTGLLIITDDGDFAHNVISPKKKVYKTYLAKLDNPVDASVVAAFEKGVVLADGTVCKSAVLEPLEDNRARVIICEGKYHQIKRMFGVFGIGVDELHRESIGNLKLPENLTYGKCMELAAKTALESVFQPCFH